MKYDFVMVDLVIHFSRLTIYVCHSVLKLFTGFAIAAFIAWKLTVARVIIIAPKPVAINIHHGIFV